MVRCIGRVAVVLVVGALALAPSAAAQVEPYGFGDYGGFRNILPPGVNGFDDLAQAAEFKAAGTYPPHSNDQLGATPPPRTGCSSSTCSGTRARATSRSSPAAPTSAWTSRSGRTSPTASRTRPTRSTGRSSSPDGRQILSDATNYVDGINAYIDQAESPLNALTMLPAEYAATGHPTGPQPFTVEDLVSIATLVGGIFGNGGRQQLSNAVLYENMKSAFGSDHFTVAGSPELTSQPAKKTKKKPTPKKHKGKGTGKGKPKKSADNAESGSRSVVASAARARPTGTSAGKALLGAGKLSRDHSGFGTFLSFVDPSTPRRRPPSTASRSPTRRSRSRATRSRRRSRCPTPGLSSTSTRSSPAPPPRASPARPRRDPRVGPRRSPGSPARPAPACSDSPARCRTRCW